MHIFFMLTLLKSSPFELKIMVSIYLQFGIKGGDTLQIFYKHKPSFRCDLICLVRIFLYFNNEQTFIIYGLIISNELASENTYLSIYFITPKMNSLLETL